MCLSGTNVPVVEPHAIFRHGPLTPCNSRQSSQIVQEYLRLSTHSPRRQLIEQELGKSNLAKLVRRYKEDEQSREWVERRTTPCPGCSVPFEKSYGAFDVRFKKTSILTTITVLSYLGCNHVRSPNADVCFMDLMALSHAYR
jgi:hypothetical protein